MKRAVVTGAGGFIGDRLVRYLQHRGYWVRGIDIKRPEFRASTADDFVLCDLRNAHQVMEMTTFQDEIDEVYALAADMGGIGYITSSLADIAVNNTLININTLKMCQKSGIGRVLFSSSACVYPKYLQDRRGDGDNVALREWDAIPAEPEPGYGWEKLFAEQLYSYYHEDHGLETRIVRFHNVYGPYGTYDGGKEKAPAALCRKVALADDGGTIDVWGDGKQTRSFLFINDCLEGIFEVMQSDYRFPVNIGSTELVTINGLVDLITSIAGKEVHVEHDLSKPQGVRDRNSDNTIANHVIGWHPRTSLRVGLEPTYRWIGQMVAKSMDDSEL